MLKNIFHFLRHILQHRSLPDEIKIPMYDGIKSIIKNNGDDFKIYDTIELYLARKP